MSWLSFRGLVQIAGVIDLDDVNTVVTAGADSVGIPLRLGFHEPDVTESEAARLAKAIPPAHPVLITYCCDAEDIVGLCDLIGADTAQLHGEVTAAEVRRVRQIRPDLAIICSLIVYNSNPGLLLARAHELAPEVDAFLTDTFDPQTGACGATGKPHDWRVSASIARQVPRPIILAGGLRPETVAEAIRIVQPAGVDVHTGVEDSQGRKDLKKTTRFVMNAHRAFQSLWPPLEGCGHSMLT
ncbi:phosphoribosylanthranilate isomerase [Streptomyces sp. NPDC057686]|uniref:phosphoribosylanthranilate isomerase n=1 Tax=Streptomyces sp. NPDC057686 TaxID=3346212 RepID=UPI0036C405DB